MKYHVLRIFGAMVALAGISLIVGLLFVVSESIEPINFSDDSMILLYFVGSLALVMAFAGTNLAINPRDQESLVPKVVLVISGGVLVFSMISVWWHFHQTGERLNHKGLSMTMGLGLAFLYSGLKKAKPSNNSFQG